MKSSTEAKCNEDIFFVRSSLPSEPPNAAVTEKCVCIRVLQPLLTYMKFIGLDHTFCRPAFRPLFKLYSLLVLLLQIAAVISCIAQIDPPNEGLKTTTTLKVVSIIYFAIGAASTVLLCIFQRKMSEVRNAIVRELPEGSELPDHDSLLRTSKILVAVGIAFSFLNAFSLFATQMGFVKMPPMYIYFKQFPYSLLDELAVWYTQNSQMMAASVLTVFCCGIRKSVIKIGDDMLKKADGDIFDFQKQYQAMTDAATLLEEGYSLFILFVYAVSVPLTSFILFTILRGDDIDLLGGAVLLFWGFDTLFLLLFISIPPILLSEQGEILTKKCYQMYTKHVGSEKNTMLFQQSVQFLASQITAAPLSMSAGNFFILSREMLLALFSQILTYFIIVMQF